MTKEKKTRTVEERWYPYFKPTRRIHGDSGYRVFEIGYIHHDQKTKVVIGSCCDHIWNYNKTPKFNMDLLRNGCIRCHEVNLGLKWSCESFCLSTMELEYGWPSKEVIEPLNHRPAEEE